MPVSKEKQVSQQQLNQQLDPFFSADNGLIKKLNIPWYCIFNDLSFKTSLEKIGTTFRAIHRGQRSKQVIFGKIHHFLCILYLKEAVNVLELVYDITMSIIFQVIPVWRRSVQFLDSTWRSKVKKRAFQAKFAIFCDFFLCKQQNLHQNWCILLLFRPSIMYYP